MPGQIPPHTRNRPPPEAHNGGWGHLTKRLLGRISVVRPLTGVSDSFGTRRSPAPTTRPPGGPPSVGQLPSSAGGGRGRGMGLRESSLNREVDSRRPGLGVSAQ